jgi:hypothetical protein
MRLPSEIQSGEGPPGGHFKTRGLKLLLARLMAAVSPSAKRGVGRVVLGSVAAPSFRPVSGRTVAIARTDHGVGPTMEVHFRVIRQSGREVCGTVCTSVDCAPTWEGLL